MNLVAVFKRGRITVIRPQGRLTIGAALDALHDTVLSALDHGARFVALDLSATTYLDSAALGEIVAARRRVRDASGAFALAGCSGKVRDLMLLTRLDTLVALHDTLDDAVRALEAVATGTGGEAP